MVEQIGQSSAGVTVLDLALSPPAGAAT